MSGVFMILVCVMLFSSHAQFQSPAAPSGGVLLEALCEPDAQIPDDLIQCGPCRGRCGTKTDPNDLDYEGPGDLCSCDEFCGFHGDCCEDFQEFCPGEFNKFQGITEVSPSLLNYDDLECKTLPTGYLRSIDNLMVTKCASDGSDCEFESELNEDVNTFVPMYDKHRGVHYISGQCAMCNGAKDVTPWGVTLDCNPVEEQKDYIASGVINSTESLSDIKQTGSCKVYYSISGPSRPCFDDVVSSCKPSCQNERLVSLCESEFQSLTVVRDIWRDVVYRNEYCAVCNAEESTTTADLKCSGYFSQFIIQSIPTPRPEGSFFLTLIFDFDPRKGLTVGQHPPPECAAGEVYVTNEDVCRPITCRSGFVLDGSDCIPEPSNISAIISGTFTEQPTIQMISSLHQDKTILESKIQETMVQIMETFNITTHNLEVTSNIENTKDSFRIENVIQCNCDFSPLHSQSDVFTRFENSIMLEIRRDTLGYLLAANTDIDTIDAHVVFDLANATAFDLELEDCTWLVYQPNETAIINDTVTVVKTKKTYSSGKFEILDDAVIVCETDLGGGEAEEDDYLALSIITAVCVGISIICLVIRLILQFVITSFRNRPGKLQFQLTVAFLFTFIMLLMGPFLRYKQDACTTAAILLAYGFLAAFVWMNVIAMDTWLVFRPSAAFSRSDEEDRSLEVHFVCGWGIPLLLVILPIGMNYSDVDERFIPEFGGFRCWYTQRYAMLVYFGVPLALSILLNTCLYILTAINLNKAFKNATNVIKAERYHFAIYVRLFILMGITWVFGFISAFTDQTAIDIIFVILTSLQGLFLFISFVCNKRVLAEFRKKIKGETSSSSGKQTKSTPLPSYNSNSMSDSKV